MPDPAVLTANPTASPRDRIEISVPLRSEYLSTLRTMAATLGADVGFSIDEIDDVRLGIGEVVAALLDLSTDADGRVSATFLTAADELTVTIPTPATAPQLQFDELAMGILRSVVDHFEITADAVTLVKRATEASDHDSSTDR